MAEERDTRRRILEAAGDLFYREGINATGVERIASTASVSKRTLYQHFPSKEALVEEYLRGFVEQVRPDSGDRRSPRSRLLAVFDRPEVPGRIRGCPLHNAAVEAADEMPGVRRIVQRQKQAFLDSLVELARQAGAANPRRLGGQLAVLHEGAAALSTSTDDPAAWASARGAARELIDTAIEADRSTLR